VPVCSDGREVRDGYDPAAGTGGGAAMTEEKGLQDFLDAMAREWDISPEFQQSSNHPYSCKCASCADWWRKMGPDEDGYGPFTKEELGIDTD